MTQSLEMTLSDEAVPENLRITNDGYLVGEARVARTGIQEYRAAELGLTDRDPDSIIRVYRPEQEVFSQDSMSTYAYRPVTVDHPPVQVTADNWKEYSRGQTGPDVARDGEHVRVPMVLMDKDAIQEWKDGKRQLSMGYKSEITFSDGATPDGEVYDAIQSNLRMNHLALVARARGGSKLKLGDTDKLEEDLPMTDKLKTVTVDGLSVETTDAGAQAIEKLQNDVKDAAKRAEDAENKRQEEVAAKDTEIGKKDAEIDDLKGKVMDAEALDAAVRERADLIAKAKTIADKDYSGKTPDDIRKTAVSAKLGDSSIADKSAEYVTARFDILAEDAAKDPVRSAVQGAHQTMPTTDADSAHAEYVKSLNDGSYHGGAK